MGYEEQAEKINTIFKEHLDGIDVDKKEVFINAILRFGQVAKFRCRSNTAYDNFSNLVFKDVAKLDRVQLGDKDFKTLVVSVLL